MEINKVVEAVTTANNLVPQSIKGKIEDFLDEKIKDPKLIESILQDLCNHYGEYAFYNDFSKYIAEHKVIEHTIDMFNSFGQRDVISKEHFCAEQCDAFFLDYSSYTSFDRQEINDAFAYIYLAIFNSKVCLSTHSEGGKIQLDFATLKDQEAFHHSESLAEFSIIKNMISTITPLNPKESKDDMGEPSAKVSAFLKEIDNVNEQDVDGNTVLQAYQNLLGRVPIELIDEPKNQIQSVICSIECRIALHRSNLGNITGAFDSLDKIATGAKEKSKLFYFVKAAIIVNHCIDDKYEEAQSSINKALEIDPQYHSAFFVKEYLSALKKEKTFDILSSEMESRIKEIRNVQDNQALLSNYSVYYGLICKEFEKYIEAEQAFKKAVEYGYDSNVASYNIGLLYYSQATKEYNKEERVFCPKVDSVKLSKIIELFKDNLVDNERLAIPQFLLVRMVGIYVSSCSLLGIKHKLDVGKYISLPGIEYEVLRMLILGADCQISDDWMQRLDKNDQFQAILFNCQKTGNNEGIIKAFSELSDEDMALMPEPSLYMYLQACIIVSDYERYQKYRPLIKNDEAEVIACMDAYCLEASGNLEKAKLIIDYYSQIATDSQIINNAMRFYARNDFVDDLQKLSERVLALFSDGKIYFENKLDFYTFTIPFFVKQKSEFTEQLITALDSDSLHSEQAWRLKAYYYETINNITKLIDCYNYLYAETNDYSYGFNRVLCFIKAMQYEIALTEASNLLSTIHESDIKKQTDLIWIISDIYLFLNKNDDSFEWAKKAHDLNIDRPENYSHQKYFLRGTLTNHMSDSIPSTLMYKSRHPVVTNDWLKEVTIPSAPSEKAIINALEEAIGTPFDEYSKQEKEITALYKQGNMPNSFLLKYYNYDLSQFFVFASKNKLQVSKASYQEIQNIKGRIQDDIIVDALSLIALFHYRCFDIIETFPHVHICYSTVSFLQGYIPTMNSFYVKDILDWIQTSKNIILEADGFLPEVINSKLFEMDNLQCCEISIKKEIPYLTIEPLLEDIYKISTNKCLDTSFTISPVLLLYHVRDNDPVKANELLYNLLSECTFVNFSFDTILDAIRKSKYQIDENTLNRFFFCNSSCDMISFANTYLETIKALLHENKSAAEQLALMVLTDANRIWKQGTHYRFMLERYDDLDSKIRCDAINQYVVYMLYSIKEIFNEIPLEMQDVYNVLNKEVIHQYCSENLRGHVAE